MDKFNRAVRRQHIARLKNKRKHYWGHGTEWWQCPVTAKFLGKVVQYTKPCACWMCVNPRRKYSGEVALTIQELRHVAQFEYDILENDG